MNKQDNLLEKVLLELSLIKQELSDAKDTIKSLQKENKQLNPLKNNLQNGKIQAE